MCWSHETRQLKLARRSRPGSRSDSKPRRTCGSSLSRVSNRVFYLDFYGLGSFSNCLLFIVHLIVILCHVLNSEVDGHLRKKNKLPHKSAIVIDIGKQWRGRVPKVMLTINGRCAGLIIRCNLNMQLHDY